MKGGTFVVLMFGFLQFVGAQKRLNSLKAPTAPASSILNLQPSVVLAPKSYEALEAAFYSNAVDDGLVIPNDFALEFMPYWIQDHSLSLLEYLYPKTIQEQLWRNASFSIASTQNFVLNDTVPTNAIALGFRTRFYFPNKSDRDKVDTRIRELRSNQRTQAAIGAQLVPLAIAEPDYDRFWAKGKDIVALFLSKEYPGITEEELTRFLTNLYEQGNGMGYDSSSGNTDFLQLFMNHIDQQLNGEQLFNEFEDYIRNRYGLSVAIAYANLISFPTNTFEYSFLPRQGIWITPSYQCNERWWFLKVQGVLRYEWYDTDYYDRFFENPALYRNNFDYGVAVSREFNDFSIQLEAVGRGSRSKVPGGFDGEGRPQFLKVRASDFQYILSFGYNLTEQIHLSYSLGNRFASAGDPQGTLVSLLGLNFGFGAADKSDLDLTLYDQE